MRALWVIVLCSCGRFAFDATNATDGAQSGDGNEVPFPDADLTDAPPPPLNVVGGIQPRVAAMPPLARRSSGAAVANDNRIWIFGGFATTGNQNDVAAYTPATNTWATIAATGAPSARERHVVEWDSANNVLVVFGGQSGTFPQFAHLDQLYFFNPTTNAWTMVPKAGTWPAARKDAVMVWVPSLNKFLLYGGNDASGMRFSELWTLSINIAAPSATWTLLSPGGAAPPAQSAPCAGLDAQGRRLLLYGGELSDNNSAATTYQYSIDTNNWQLDTTSGTSPGARAFSQCAWIPSVGRLALYGGQANSGAPIAGTFAYEPNAKKWETVPMQSGSVNPGNCGDGGTAYSATLGGMFWFGGRTATISYSNESYVLQLQPQ